VQDPDNYAVQFRVTLDTTNESEAEAAADKLGNVLAIALTVVGGQVIEQEVYTY
jgi:hypothetical protein